MKKLNPKAILIPTVALLLICLVSTTVLALTNNVTKDKIALNALETESASRKTVCEAAESFSEITSPKEGITLCTAFGKDKDTVGYIYTGGAKGYGGLVSVMVGIDNEGKITGVEILSHSETPGLGANSVKPEFKNRFIGKSGELTVNKNSNEGQNIQAITAATITSKAVTSAVNEILALHSETLGGENNG